MASIMPPISRRGMHRTLPPWSSVLLAALSLLALCEARSATATDNLRIEAPEALQQLLTKHIDAYRDASGALDAAEIARMQQRARQQATELLATQGYFSPTIDFDIGLPPGVETHLMRVDPGPRTTVGGVRIDFTGAVAEARPEYEQRRQALRDAWPLHPGDSFVDAQWRSGKTALLRLLTERDFAAARIAQSQATVDPDAASASLSVLYDSGPAYTLGDIEVTGLSRYGPELVKRYARFDSGAPYSPDVLLDFQRRLQNSPYFSTVLVDVAPEATTGDQLPVRVSVTEEKSRHVTLSAGYSTNTGARTEIAYQQADFLGRPWNLVTGLRIEQLRQAAYADMFLPPDRDDWVWSFGTLAEATDIRGLRTRRAAAGVVRSRTTEKIDQRVSLTLQEERTAVQDGPVTLRTALFPGWSWTRREVDNVLDPRRGNVLNLQAHAGTKLLLSDQNFFRAYAQAHLYYPVGEWDVASVRVEAGQVFAPSSDGVPQQLLFRAGGTRSVRGYAYQSLGPRVGSAVVGGRSLLTMSAEYTHWFVHDWGAAVFVDAGNAADTWSNLDLRVGYGAGPRWRSPAGPVAVDLAYAPRERRVRLHFSLQVAF
ncbi:MAG: autotransporter assembly complex protein TamA [Pseudomonadota bacterium]|nr:autotransporter assembly complex protein TamA [Pseudomonadota bacterium]